MVIPRGRCWSCVFWARDIRPEYSDYGHCKRFPPQLVWQISDWGQDSPWVTKTDWCGEYKENKTAREK